MANTKIILIIFFVAKDKEALSAKTRPGADCGSDNELFIAKFKIKVGKTTTPLVYDLNHIPYNVSVERTHSFKGLDLID